ncbi:MAG: hypothetical protein GY811_05955 [Myxococcales bacterium]|nr:hypothetical protein [Myxococcales bacterium]
MNIAQTAAIAIQLIFAEAEPNMDTVFGRDFGKVEFHEDRWTVFRMNQLDEPIPCSVELGKGIMNDRALGIPGEYGGYFYVIQYWTRLGEILLFRPDPYPESRQDD